MNFEQRVNLFVITVPEEALTHKINDSKMVIGQCKEFITKKDGIPIAMNIEIINGEVIESLEALIGKQWIRESLEFWEGMEGMGSKVRSKDFGHEESFLRGGGSEDSGFFLTVRHLNFKLFKQDHIIQNHIFIYYTNKTMLSATPWLLLHIFALSQTVSFLHILDSHNFLSQTSEQILYVLALLSTYQFQYGFILFCILLYLRIVDFLFIVFIYFIADNRQNDILRSTFLQLVHPFFHNFKRILRTDIINAQCYSGLFVVDGSYRTILLLTCCIPKLSYFHFVHETKFFFHQEGYTIWQWRLLPKLAQRTHQTFHEWSEEECCFCRHPSLPQQLIWFWWDLKFSLSFD